ncbi:MAG TPA: hypothetical protein VFG04_14630 [Planctomycetaceae bacterium]|jgi:hypothetical protein|nr:hypothetical protein [Planctomycetaceae bacterium]
MTTRSLATRVERSTGPKTKRLFVVAICSLALAGCGRSVDREEQAYRDTGLTRVPVGQVSGVVTIDGAAPAPFTLVMLADPQKPDAAVLRAICDSEGRFAFTSYDSGDGVPPGKYVVLFAQFNVGRPLGTFEPPDLMKNLYNDPDKNASNPEFQVTVELPGRTDYHFNLTVAGEPPSAPGPHAVTEVKAAM